MCSVSVNSTVTVVRTSAERTWNPTESLLNGQSLGGSMSVWGRVHNPSHDSQESTFIPYDFVLGRLSVIRMQHSFA